MNGYMKHSGFFELLKLHKGMSRFYWGMLNYIYIETKEHGEIPVLQVAISSFNRDNGTPDIDKDSINVGYLPDLSVYAKGFIDGYLKGIEVFIETPVMRKEAVIRTATKNILSFRIHHGGERGIELNHQYEDGFYEGERYKAWEIIFQAPNEFSEYFSDYIPEESGSILKNGPSSSKCKTNGSVENNSRKIKLNQIAFELTISKINTCPADYNRVWGYLEEGFKSQIARNSIITIAVNTPDDINTYEYATWEQVNPDNTKTQLWQRKINLTDSEISLLFKNFRAALEDIENYSLGTNGRLSVKGNAQKIINEWIEIKCLEISNTSTTIEQQHNENKSVSQSRFC